MNNAANGGGHRDGPKKKKKTYSSFLMDDDDNRRAGGEEKKKISPMLQVVEDQPPASKTTTTQKRDEAWREMAALQESDPEGFATMVHKALAEEGDVDRKGLELPGGDVLLKPDGSRQQVNQPRVSIVPTPSFVIKTFGHKLTEFSEAGQAPTKVFINVCSHPDVEEPHPEKKLDDAGKEIDAIRVPVSIGPEKKDVDNRGDECIVVDCVVHPSITDQQDFLCQLVVGYVEKKYQLALDREKIKLPRLKYKGDKVTEQWIRAKKKVVVVEEEEDVVKVWPPELGPPPKLVSLRVDGQDVDSGEPMVSTKEKQKLTVEFECSRWRGTKISHSTFAVRLNVPGLKEIKTIFPLGVKNMRHERHHNTLLLTFDVDHDIFEKPDPGSQPYMVGRALMSEDEKKSSSLLRGKASSNAKGDIVDKYHLANEKDEAQQVLRTEKPPKGASAADIAYAAAEVARIAAMNSVDKIAEDEVLPEDKFHKADIISQHYISQREAQAQERRRQDTEEDDDSTKEPAPPPPREEEHGEDEEAMSTATTLPESLKASTHVPLTTSLWAELL